MSESSGPESRPEPRIKGAGIQPFLAWYRGAYGDERLREAVARLAPAHRGSLPLKGAALSALSASWYPAAAIHALLDSIVFQHPPEERPRMVEEGARAIIESTLTGVYRVLFTTMITPERYARHAQTLFGRFYEPGTMTKTPLGASGHLTIVRDWTAHHPFLCDLLVHTAHYVYAAMGCRELRIRRTACIAEGAPDCRFEVLWSA